MKRAVTVLIVIGLLTGAAIAAVSLSATSVRINIPFAFHAGDQLMPAGEYWIELPNSSTLATGSMVRVASLDASLCQYLFSSPVVSMAKDTDWHLTFSKIGDQYFLATIRNSEVGAALPKSRSEKALAREYATGNTEAAVVHLIAHVRKGK